MAVLEYCHRTPPGNIMMSDHVAITCSMTGGGSFPSDSSSRNAAVNMPADDFPSPEVPYIHLKPLPLQARAALGFIVMSTFPFCLLATSGLRPQTILEIQPRESHY